MAIIRRDTKPEISVPVLVIGGGACGLVAALAAHDAGAEVMVLERDDSPSGSTALSSGFIPACGTRWQREKDVADDAALMVADIQAKNHDEADPDLAQAVAAASGPTLEWLADAHAQNFVLVEGFLYPGHSRLRMHANPAKTGEALIGNLLEGVAAAGIDVVTGAHVLDLIVDGTDRVIGVSMERPDGGREEIGCEALVLACNGYGGNAELVRRHIPEMADALYFGHVGNQGDAVAWGEALGGRAVHMGAYQGHGSVAHPHGVLITWALMMEGGIQVNAEGRRFSNEHEGYSEQSVKVLAQPGGVAWNVYDDRLHEMGLGFDDYRRANEAGAIRRVDSVEDLAALIGCPVEALRETLSSTADLAARGGSDGFGRDFSKAPALGGPPFHVVKVTGALFHTQGGLDIDTGARVLGAGGAPLPNLFAGGGAAVGLSGTGVEGYLSGNGLLTAVVLGRIAGEGAAAICTKG